MSKVMFSPTLMWLCLAVSLVAGSMALTAPISLSPRRNLITSTDKESLKHDLKPIANDETQLAQPTAASLLDTSAISEDSYTLVGGLRDDDAMERFIRRLLHSHGKTVSDEGALKGFVPWFSGTKATQNFSEMKRQLFEKEWVIDASNPSSNPSPVSFLPESGLARMNLTTTETKQPTSKESNAILNATSNESTSEESTSKFKPTNLINVTNKEAKVSISKHGIRQMQKQQPKEQSDRPKHLRRAYEQSVSKNMWAPDQAESSAVSKSKRASVIKQDSDDCANACYNGKHAGLPWEDHKCSWKRCSGCKECLTAQTPTVSEASLVAKPETKSKKAFAIQQDAEDCANACYNGKHAGLPWEDHKCSWKRCSGCKECLTAQTSTVSEASLVAKPESKSKNASAIEQETADDCANACYNDKHAGLPWEDHKCSWKRCSGCKECFTAQTPTASLASLVAKPESKSKNASAIEQESSSDSKSRVQSESLVEDVSSSGFGDTVVGPQAHGTQHLVVRAQDDDAPTPVGLRTALGDIEERHGATSSRDEATRIPTAKTSHDAPVAAPSLPGSATAPVAAMRPGSVETPPVKEDLLVGVRSLVDSQSQIVSDITSKIVELKVTAGKVDSSNRQSLDEAKALYQRKLLDQQMNTTRLRNINKHLDEDIKALLSNNTKLRQQAQELNKQSLALRVQITAVESNLSLAQEFASKELFDGSSDDFQFMEDLRMNESEVAKVQTHALAVDHFGEKNSMALLQRGTDVEPLDLLNTVEDIFTDLSVQAEASKLALEQSFEHLFSQEAMVQESVLVKQRALLDEKQEQLALHAKLIDVVAHAGRMKNFLSNRLLRLRSYALRLSRQYS